MQPTLHAAQIKAARAYLDWSQEDLAHATGLAINTIRNLELGYISPREKTVNVIRQAVEKAGIEFMEPAGVRPRMDEIKIFDGGNSCDDLLDDIIQTARKTDGEIAVIVPTQEMLARALGVTGHNDLDRLKRLENAAVVKCLLFNAIEPPYPVPAFSFRVAPMNEITPTPYFVYGNKHALVMNEHNSRFRFVVFTLPGLAHTYRAHFHAVWENAEPLNMKIRKRA